LSFSTYNSTEIKNFKENHAVLTEYGAVNQQADTYAIDMDKLRKLCHSKNRLNLIYATQWCLPPI